MENLFPDGKKLVSYRKRSKRTTEVILVSISTLSRVLYSLVQLLLSQLAWQCQYWHGKPLSRWKKPSFQHILKKTCDRCAFGGDFNTVIKNSHWNCENIAVCVRYIITSSFLRRRSRQTRLPMCANGSWCR